MRALTVNISWFSFTSFISFMHLVWMFTNHFSGNYSSICLMKGIKLNTCKVMIRSFQVLLWLNSARNLWITYLRPITNNRQKNIPKISPSRTWFKLWAPKYILDIGTKMTNKILIQIFLNLLPAPLYSSRIPNPAMTENQLCPLGFPYSIGQ